MSKNIFFEQKGPFLLSQLLENVKIKNKIKFFDVKTLTDASIRDLTFFESSAYIEAAKNTKALFCLTTDKLKNYLPKSCEAIIVKNVLFELCKITKKFYPTADIDTPDRLLKVPKKTLYLNVKFGNNILVGKNCKIGKNTSIGSNTIIESNVLIGNNCVIGSQVVLRNSLMRQN